MNQVSSLVREFPDAVCRWPAGTVLIEQGKPSDSLHIVIDGRLEVWTDVATRADRVETLGPGEIAGEVTLLDPGPATATIRAGSACKTLHLRGELLRQLWQRNPRLASAVHSEILLTLAGRLRFATCNL